MRKIIASIFILFALTLVACTEITDDVEKAQKPSIELNNEGELVQIYEENEELEDVTFEVVLNKFAENNIKLEEVIINWYIRGELITEYTNETTITQVVKTPGDITIRVEVLFTFETKEQKLEADSLVRVIKTPTNILVTNSVDANTHRVGVTLGLDSEIEFTGRITGNLKHSIIKWVIQKQTNNEPLLVEEVLIEELEVLNNVGTAKLTYKFEERGSYIVTLQTGAGISQDANKYISNSTHVNVGFGEFKLTNQNDKVLSTETGFSNRLLTVSPLNAELVGEGTYEWYLNGEKLVHEGLELTHTNTDLGGYLYQVLFVPNNTELDIIKTEKLLIVNGVEVSTEEELLLQLSNKTKGIILKDDIHYNSAAASLDLDYAVTIYGNGKVLTSNEIEVFINVKSDNVYLSNLTIKRANRYNLMYTRVDNGYLEDIQMEELGGGSNTSAFLSGEFGSGLYINKSEVTVHNISFISGGLVGIRIDNDSSGTSKKAKLELTGEFKYSVEDPLMLPIGSGKSGADGVEVIATGFDYFALPAGSITIRRWDNQGDPVTWEIYEQQKTEYLVGDYLDLFGIGIKVEIGFLGLEISDASGLDFVKMYINMFKQYGKLDITNVDDEVLTTYYIVGETSDEVYGLDKLVYSLTKDLDVSNQVRPELPDVPGEYKLKIYIGDDFYLGSVTITIE